MLSRRRRKIRIAHRGRFVLFVCLFAIAVLGFCVRTIYAVRREVDKRSSAMQSNMASETGSSNVMDTGTIPIKEIEPKESVSEEKDSISQNIDDPYMDVEGEQELSKERGDEDKNLERTERQNPKREIFSDSVFLGDSITEPLSFYKFIERSRVIADKGLTAQEAFNRVDEVVALNPEKIFILFGMNDILSLDRSEDFIANYTRLISEIERELPNTQIYVQSILHVDAKVQEKKPLLTNARIDDFNKALQVMAEDQNIKYLDINSIADQYSENLLEPDGIHYVYKFYGLWLDYIEKHI